jgi:hypothetical protein
VTRLAAFGLLLLLQAVCALVFMLDILLSAFGAYQVPLSWSTRELLEMGAGLGLFLGLILGTILVLRAVRDLNRAEARLDRASAAFVDLLNARFDQWGLTAAIPPISNQLRNAPPLQVSHGSDHSPVQVRPMAALFRPRS